jgi:glycosyltransferase involved in cell wall biosynthesis
VGRVRLGLIVQRYGDEVVGGAEIHARLVAEHLAARHEVEVLTTTAADYRTWRGFYAPGPATVGGLPLVRFPVVRERVERDFDELSNRCCYFEHTPEDERLWIEEHGPVAPGLVEHLQREHARYERLIFFCYRYWTSYQGLKVAPGKSLLVPTAEHDRVLYFGLFGEMLRQPRAIVYNSVEERDLIWRVTKNRSVAGEVVGVGINEAPYPPEDEIRKKYDLPERYVLYVGRIEREKGCLELLSHFLRFVHETGSRLQLVLVGARVDQVPDHPSVTYLGVVPDEDKLGLMAACELLVMPSRYESLSMVLLEAWSVGTPALVNGDCEVLRGQCYRSNGGLMYRDYAELAEALQWLLEHPAEARLIGAQGREYYEQNYAWPVIDAKYDRLLELEPEPTARGG